MHKFNWHVIHTQRMNIILIIVGIEYYLHLIKIANDLSTDFIISLT